jgi:hypothetical protein
MNTVHVTVTGSDTILKDLEAFLRQEGIEVRESVMAANQAAHHIEAVGAGLSALAIIAKYDVIPRAIAAFRKTRKPVITITRNTEQKGIEKLECYDLDAVSKFLQEREIHIEDSSDADHVA